MTTPIRGRIYVSGENLSDIRILDSVTLNEVDRIPTETNMNRRLVISDYLEEEEMNLVAFSGRDSSNQSHVSIHNSITNERLSQIVDVPGISCLEILSSFSSSSSPIVVSGGFSHLCAYNSLTTEKLVECRKLLLNDIKRIKCFPEWNLNEVFIGGQSCKNGLIKRYDLNQDCVILGSYVGHRGSYHFSDVNGITASLTDGILISGSNDDNGRGTLKLWSKDTFECIESVNLDKPCFSLDYCSDSHLICCGTKNEIEIWDIRNMRKKSMLLFNVQNRIRKVGNVGNGSVRDLDQISNVTNSSPLFVSGCWEYVSIWNSITGKELKRKVLLESNGKRCNILGIRFIPLPSSSSSSSSPSYSVDSPSLQSSPDSPHPPSIQILEEDGEPRRLFPDDLQIERREEESEESIQTLREEVERLRREREEALRLLREEASQREAAERQIVTEREEKDQIERQLQETERRMTEDNETLTNELTVAKERFRVEREEKERIQREFQETESRMQEENDQLRRNEGKALRKMQQEVSERKAAERRLVVEREDKAQIQREAEETERRIREEVNSTRLRNVVLENELKQSKEECTRIEAHFEEEKIQMQTESRILRTANEDLRHRIIALTDRLGIEAEADSKPFVVRIISPSDSIIVRGDTVQFGITPVDTSTRIESVRFGPIALYEEEEEDGEDSDSSGSLLEVECPKVRLRPETYPLIVNDIEIEQFDVVSGEAMTYYAVVHESLTLEALSCLVRCEVQRGNMFRRVSNLFGLSDDAVGGEIEPLRSAIEDFAGVAVNDCELVRNRWIEVKLRPKKARKIQKLGRFFLVQGVGGEKKHVVTLEREPPKHFVHQSDVVETPGTDGVISRTRLSTVRCGILDIGPTTFEVAIKKQWFEFNKKYPGSLLDAEREVIMMCECDHPNVLRCRGCYVVPDDRGVTLFILSDFCPDGTVLHWLRGKEENGTLRNVDKISCLEQTATGMLYLHRKGLIHRDLKPANALMKNGQVKLCDLGFTRHQNSLISRTMRGTPEYMSRQAKEVFELPIPNDEMFLVDIYAFGICMWEIWTLDDPYAAEKDVLVRRNLDVSRGVLNLVHPPRGSGRESIRPPVDECDGMSQGLVDLMVRCWDDDVTVRPEFDEIVRVLSESY